MSGGLGFNKIAGALLATGLVVVGLNIGSEMIFHQAPPERPGWRIEAAEAAAAGAAGGPAVEGPIDWGTVLPAANVGSGEALHRRCVSCHTFENGGPNGIGPNLWGTVLRPVASHAGYDYSAAMRAHAAEAPVWSYDELSAFLRNPQQHVSGTKMTYAGLRGRDDRINLIAYLRTLAASPAAIPAPDPARAEGAAAGAAPAAGAAAPGAAAGAIPPAGDQPSAEQNPAAEGVSAQAGNTTTTGSPPPAAGGAPAQSTGPSQTRNTSATNNR